MPAAWHSDLSLSVLRPTRMGSGMVVSLGESATPPCLMMATMDRMRCWLVPMRPVTPFMMMPILCVFMASLCCGSDVLAIGVFYLLQELPLVPGPVPLGEDLHLVET